jgi:hypothetical protein
VGWFHGSVWHIIHFTTNQSCIQAMVSCGVALGDLPVDTFLLTVVHANPVSRLAPEHESREKPWPPLTRAPHGRLGSMGCLSFRPARRGTADKTITLVWRVVVILTACRALENWQCGGCSLGKRPIPSRNRRRKTCDNGLHV